METKVNILTYSKQDLANLYSIDRGTFRKWILRIMNHYDDCPFSYDQYKKHSGILFPLWVHWIRCKLEGDNYAALMAVQFGCPACMKE